MKTKNVKARLKDIKQGVTLYVAHPVYGIDKYVVMSKPYLNKHTNSLFIKTKVQSDLFNYTSDNSLRDMGVTALYNDRRTFFKLKHAVKWMDVWVKDTGFQRRHTEHLTFCRSFDFDYE